MNDLISREAVITAVTEYAAWLWRTYREPCNLQGYIEAIERVPSAQERKKGKWEEWWPGDCALIMTGEEMLWMCSERTAKFSGRSAYCPNCGADMRGEEE